jgi:hypothetical protein
VPIPDPSADPVPERERVGPLLRLPQRNAGRRRGSARPPRSNQLASHCRAGGPLPIENCTPIVGSKRGAGQARSTTTNDDQRRSTTTNPFGRANGYEPVLTLVSAGGCVRPAAMRYLQRGGVCALGPDWQCGGQGFEPPQLHSRSTLFDRSKRAGRRAFFTRMMIDMGWCP